MKDWTGDGNSVFRMLGSSNHHGAAREENDFYATDPRAAEMLIGLESLKNPIWEPACGQGHLSKVFSGRGLEVKSTDLVDRGFGASGVDFLACTDTWKGDIITNPPYRYAKEFVAKALSLVADGNKVAMFLKVQFMEGKGRKLLFAQHPPRTIWVSSSRINCAKDGNFEMFRTSGGSPIAYAWFVWEKGFKGDTVLKWFN